MDGFAVRTCASDTLTNFACLDAELKGQGYKHVFLLTSDQHIGHALTIGRIVLGRQGIAVTPLPVASNAGATLSLLRIVEDAVSAAIWSITGMGGANNDPRPHERAPASHVGGEPTESPIPR